MMLKMASFNKVNYNKIAPALTADDLQYYRYRFLV